MSARLRLDLIVRSYPPHGGIVFPHEERPVRWTWRLWSGSRIVATSGSQLYSRRIDCARGAEVGAGICGVVDYLRDEVPARRHHHLGSETVDVRITDERTP